MIRKLLVIMTVVASITHSTDGSPDPHHHRDDEYDPIIRLLKEARKQRKYGGGSSNLGSASSQFSQLQYPTSSNSGGNNGGNNGGSNGGGGGSPPNPILTPGNDNRFGTVGSAIPSAGRPSSNYPPILPNFPSGSQIVGQLQNGQFPVRPQYPIEQVNRGVSTILNGVRSLDLGQILRGAFVFPRNENVRSVANNVLDSIFGVAKQQPAGGARL